ncbi:MAG: helix-turn-helix domain-containing protein [Clostridia bacterium]|nr:helix-turn-helix domain-containing protein [Clostridia bacterium]
MNVKEAVVARFMEIMQERRIKANELANLSGVTPSSVYSLLDPHRREVTVNLVKKLCDGLDIPLGLFFSAPIFDELEQEIR